VSTPDGGNKVISVVLHYDRERAFADLGLPSEPHDAP
jgi:hypothetical protein